jgi:alpha-beta hydrolase superfamily lysophospholipase
VSDSITRRETQRILSDQGERHARAWIPERPERVMVLVHGYAEHCGRYDEMAMHFARRGFAVHAYDQAGHGRTRGPRGHVDRFDRLPEEAAAFVDQVSLEHAGLPLTLIGHSVGGLVVAAAAAFLHPPVDRVVLSGAALRLGGEGAGALRQRVSLLAARVLSRFIPRLGLSAGLDAEAISRDPEVVRRYCEDPFVKDRMTVRFAAGMNQMLERVIPAAGQVERPVLILHGEEDRLTSPQGSVDFHAGLVEPVASQSALKIYPGLRHEIFNEPEREQVWRDMLTWLETS